MQSTEGASRQRGESLRYHGQRGQPMAQAMDYDLPPEMFMTTPESIPVGAPLLHTPLFDLHLELGARMVPFAGYSLPVQYPAGVMAEHLHTRAAAGLFDVSHMGQLRLVGSRSPDCRGQAVRVTVTTVPTGSTSSTKSWA